MQEFDKYIKDNLYNHESPVPTGLWERIVSEKDKKKPTPIPFWKNGYFQSALIGILAVGILSSSYLYHKNNSPLAKGSTINEKLDVIDAPNIANSIATNTREVNVNTTIKVSSLNRGYKKVSLSTTSSKEKASKVTNALANQETEKLFLLTDKTVANIGSNKRLRVTNDNNLLNKNKVTSPNLVVVNNLTNDKVVEATENDNHFYEKGIIIKTSNISLTNKLISKLLAESKKTISEIHLPQVSHKDWFIEVYASPNYDRKKVSTSSSNSFYTQALDTAQKLSTGFTVGVRIAKNLTNHLSLKSGIQFNQINERFRYKQFATKSNTVVTERSYINNDGTTVSNKDTSTYFETGYRLMTNYNTYKSIEIPVIASWEVGNNKWHFAANGGIIANIASFYEGKTYDNTLNLMPLSAKEQNGVLKSTMNLSIYGGVSFLYNIGNSFDAFAEPYCKYGISNSSSSSFGFGERFNSLGINVGIRYKIPRSSIKL